MRILRSDDNSLKLERIGNGWVVTHSYETEFTDRGGHKDTDYHNEQFAFPTLDEALTKMKEMAEKSLDTPNAN